MTRSSGPSALDSGGRIRYSMLREAVGGTSIVRLVTGFESGPPNGPSCTTVSTGLTASSKTGMCWAKSATESFVGCAPFTWIIL